MPRLESCAWSCSCAARGRHKPPPGDAAAKAGEMLSSSVSGPAVAGPGALSPSSNASTTSSTLNWSRHLVQRSVVLFVVGAFMALVLNLLQIQRNVTLFPEEVISTLFSSAWWVPPCCGTAAGEFFFFPLPWGGDAVRPSVTRAGGRAALPPPAASDANPGFWKDACPLPLYPPTRVRRLFFFPFPHSKLDFANNVQLSLTLAALSLGLWWTFDRSRSGLGLGITIAFVATLITQFLVYNGVYQYTSPDFLYIRSWLPCIFFSGGVTVGNIGRQLAMVI
ncbi:INSI1 protein, partial [Nycticryphes semicollaris]|nr:INSI1 protein [Nycticryphes semicollaris]